MQFVSDDKLADWIAAGVGYVMPDGRLAPYESAGVIGLVEGDVYQVGVLFNGYLEGRSINLHIRCANPRAIQKRYLREVFSVAYDYFKVPLIVATVSTANVDSQRLTAHAGFTLYARLPGGMFDGDALVYAMHRSECKYLPRK